MPELYHAAPDVRLLPIDEIRVGPRCRKELGDLSELAASINELGLLQPVGLDADLVLVFGERRLRAVQSLGWTDVPAIVFRDLDEALTAAKAERAENTCRKEFTPTELVEAGRRIEELEKPNAEAREQAGVRAEPSGNLPQGSPGRVREKVADALGVGATTYERAKAVVVAAETEPEKHGDLPAVMDTRSVNAAHRELKRRREQDKPAGEPEHPFAELMSAVIGLSRKFTTAIKGTDEQSRKLKAYLGAAGLLDCRGEVIDNGEVHEASAVFLPLKGVRALVEAAGLPGRPQSDASIKRLYDKASGGWIPPMVARRRSRRQGRKAGAA